MRRLWSRLRAMLRRVLDGGARDEELNEEIRTFVEHDIESRIRSGMTPEDARRAALIELGGAEQVKERVREDRAGARWESIFRDIRYAMRSMGKARGFSFSVIGSLSLGLAATIVAFAFINGALLRPFPGVRDQDHLVTLGILENSPLGPRPLRTSMADYPGVLRALREGIASLEGVASFTESAVAVTGPQSRSLQAAFVSPNYFDVLGVRTEVGRTFAPEEGRAAVAIIGHALWTGGFGRNPSVVGRTIEVGRQTFRIIGVAPQGFAGTSQNPVENGVEIWLPMALVDVVGDPSSFGDGLVLFDQRPGERAIRYVGRMREGVRVARVEAELGVIAGRPVGFGNVPTERVKVEVAGLSRLDDADAVGIAAILLSVPFLVLVIACVNAANLFLVRASKRGREIALRLALGASRSRLVRQLIIESLLLAIGAALLALPLAWSALQLLATFMIPMPLDGTVVAGALVTAFLTALGFGLVPAFQATRQHPSAALGTSPAGSGGTPSQSRVRRALVAGQVALALGLLAAAFQLTSALESLAEPPGTDPDRLLLASFDLAQLRFSTAESDAFYAALLDGASSLPGVEAAGLSSRNLARGWSWSFDPANAVSVDPGNGPVGGISVSGSADGDYFKAVGLDLIQGREFVAADRRDIPEVAIVTERLASQLFHDAALGRNLHVKTPFRGALEADLRIVGIVKSPVGLSGKEVPAIFFPSPFPSPIQHGTARTLHIRSAGPAAALAPAIRDLVAQLDPQVPILKLATLDQTIRADILLQRMLARAAALLGIVALLLASIGLYGVTSYSVATRAREIAVRIALGARTDQVVAMVLRQALAVAIIGSILGGLAAIVAGLLIQAEVFGVAGIDVATFSGSAALLAVAMILASILPARRAARLDPYAVLREE